MCLYLEDDKTDDKRTGNFFMIYNLEMLVFYGLQLFDAGAGELLQEKRKIFFAMEKKKLKRFLNFIL
ncbi:MAG TPA: hypothetical protein VL946_03020 [Lacibacter sp.]|nr:hypothetical protein [Lacibacter sp.]